MKRISAVFIACLALGILNPNARAAEAPLFTLTVKNHPDLLSAVEQVVNAGNPGMGTGVASMVPAFLGSPELAGVDPKRPWQAVAWAKETATQPVGAIYVPVTDFAAFKAGLVAGILLGGNGENTVAEKNGYAVIIGPNQPGFTDEDRDRALAWKVKAAGIKRSVIGADVAPDEEVRRQLVQAFSAMKGQALTAMDFALRNAPNAGAVNPDAMKDMMGLYFSLFETILQGTERLSVGLEVRGGDIVFRDRLTPARGSDLAEWLSVNENGVAAEVGSVDWDADMAFAMSAKATPTMTEFMEKAMAMSFKLQNIDPDESEIAEMNKLMKTMLPLVAAGSMNFQKEGFGFDGYYRFPNRDAKEMYEQLKKFMDSTMKKQVGKDKMYSDYKFEEGIRKIGDISVDRITMVYNLDSPMFAAPGQKEQMEKMFPGGKLQFEYAQSGDRFYFTMSEAMENALKDEGRGSLKGVKVGPNTTFVGQLNPIAMVKQIFAGLPASPLPPQMLDGLDATGTAISVRADVKNQLEVELRVPLKLISTIANAAKAQQAR